MVHLRRNLAEPLACLFLGGLLIAAFLLPAPLQASENDEACLVCHEEMEETFTRTAHGIYFKNDNKTGNYGCQSCHLDGTAHIESGDPALIYNPARMHDFDEAESCLSCHRGGMFSDWEFSVHSGSEVSCATCHKVHVPATEFATQSATELCYGCHSNVRSASYMPSRHPIAEGDLVCQDCHAIHGGDNRLAADGNISQLCFSCHADKEGPFIYEHAPVEEDCMICHTPHGSVADNLLKQQEPNLCLSCHPMHFHATVEGVDGEFDVPQAPERSGISTPDGFKRAMLTKCTQCHTQIHGSDLPGQAITSGGGTLVR